MDVTCNKPKYKIVEEDDILLSVFNIASGTNT